LYLPISIMFGSLLASLAIASESLAEPAKFEKKSSSTQTSSVKMKTEKDDKTPVNVKLTRAAFEGLSKEATVDDLKKWAGEPQNDIGSGIYILTYPLTDGSWALVGTPDMKKIMYIHYQAKEPKGWK